MKDNYLYHITNINNIDSIKKNGLIPQIGERRLTCKEVRERHSTDLRISLCKKSDITEWRKVLYKKEIDDNIVVLKVNANKLNLKVRHWANGDEFGCWEIINKEKIEDVVHYTSLIG